MMFANESNLMDMPIMSADTANAENAMRLIMQLRSSGVTDSAVLAAMEKIPREHFLDGVFSARANEDIALPIECGQTISQPSVVAMMTQALDVNDRQRVLEIGTGSGYQAAILSKVCRMVYTIERHKDLHDKAAKHFERLQIRNIMQQCGDGYAGWSEAAPFERIMLTAAPEHFPQRLLAQLSDNNGVMILPFGRESDLQDLIKIVKTPQGVTKEVLSQVRFVPMVDDSL